MTEKVTIQGVPVSISKRAQQDYISLTDLAKHKNPEYTGQVIAHWLSTRYTIEVMGVWEKCNNPAFNVTEFSYIKNESGSNRLTLGFLPIYYIKGGDLTLCLILIL